MATAMHEASQSHPDVIGFFRAITDAGKSVWYLVPCGLAALVGGFLCRAKEASPRVRRLAAYVAVRAFFLFVTIGGSGIVANIIKPIAGRARPRLFVEQGVFGFDPFTSAGFLWNAMPSGHSTTAFALAAGLAIFYPRLRRLWYGVAVVLAASRVAVGAHYLSDVVAGAMLGLGTVRLALHNGIFQLWQVIFPIDTPPPPR